MYAPIGGDDGAPEGGVQLSSVRAGGQSGKSMPAVEVQLPFHAGGNGGELLGGGAPQLLATSAKQRKMAGGIFCAAVLCVFLASGLVGNAPLAVENSAHGYGHADFIGDRVVMHDYDSSKVFSSFLPGIGGEYGIPMWAFYVSTYFWFSSIPGS